MPRLSENETISRRNAIIDAAESMFFSKGFLETKMEDIAIQAGLTRKTLYGYFKNKDELYLSVFIKQQKAKLDFLYERINKETIPINKFLEFGKGYYDFFELHPQYLKFQLYIDFSALNFEIIPQEILKEYTDGSLTFHYYLLDIMKEAFGTSITSEIDVLNVILHQFYFTSRAILCRSILYPDITYTISEQSLSPRTFYDIFFNNFIKSMKG